ncbi:hypothetical protein GCM10010145_36380 [Streptomyces ruber]|uniref:LigA protein n=2 Tax=Streptomyces TaxID=1883 RepID=A0A918BGA5_9ACTN|nr:hypothetical protein [Streptomyces ruber]GGQ63186.1 hypothetical protein GCM10010145_36380 [Streptomyces ruber]
MSPQEPHGDDASATPDQQTDGTADDTGKDGAAEEPEERDQPQNAWSARRDLVDHAPRTMNVGTRTRFGGSLVGGDQHGVSGGRVTGDVIMGSKTEIHHWTFSGALGTTGLPAVSAAAGEVPRSTLDRLAGSFVAATETVEDLLAGLRRDRVLVLSGARFTGRRTAALTLLHRLGASPVRTLDRDTAPGALAERIAAAGQDDGGQREDGRARGYVLCDLGTRRGSPLREPHLLAVRDRLEQQDAYLVVTVGATAVLEDVPAVGWEPPGAAEVLAAHLRTWTDETTVAGLLGLADVKEFLGRAHQLRETVAFARLLARYAAGEVTDRAVAQFSLVSLENQVQEWFEEDETAVHLRDKAFLVALAAFDGGPYALTAELSDLLYRFLQKTENPARVPEVPVFGTHIGKRLQLARAERFEDDEHTEWGPVTQQKARYVDERISLVVLREVWTGHPSARPAVIDWLRRLADDGRPLVRTRAASTVAVLARTDLPSAMALVIEPWATSSRSRHRLVAVNSLTLAHLIDTPNVPRILDTWCESDDPRLQWVAVRAYGLIGPERPEQALAALRSVVLRLGVTLDTGIPDDVMDDLADTVGLLLLSPAGDRVLAELRAHLDDSGWVHELSCRGLVHAGHHTENDEEYGTPPVLDWYARAVAEGGSAAIDLPFVLRAALGSPRTTYAALGVLELWVRIADRSPATEWALAALLPKLVTTATEHQRLSHLLRTLPGTDGAPPPPVAARLLTTLPPH